MIYKKPKGTYSRSSSFENPRGKKGCAATENKGAKGHAFDRLDSGQTQILMDFAGSGKITKMWFTFRQFLNPVVLRSLVLRCYWDKSDKPAVEVPIGDFMSVGTNPIPFENELFSSPEGRSFNTYIPMPFKTHALVTITNESDIDLSHLFYTIEFLETEDFGEDLYFHAFFNRENPTTLGKDYEILPKIYGGGTFLGVSMTLHANFNHSLWWGEGEFKAYIDNDLNPTICGTGAEDYVGTGWGLGKFIHRFQGCTFMNEDLRKWSFYRFHIPDPIYFDENIHITLQALGGGNGKEVRELVNRGAKIIPVSVDRNDDGGSFVKLMEEKFDPTYDQFDNYFINFYREDDYASVAYFYLDQPVSNLPKICSLEKRLADLRGEGSEMKRNDI